MALQTLMLPSCLVVAVITVEGNELTERLSVFIMIYLFEVFILLHSQQHYRR